MRNQKNFLVLSALVLIFAIATLVGDSTGDQCDDYGGYHAVYTYKLVCGDYTSTGSFTLNIERHDSILDPESSFTSVEVTEGDVSISVYRVKYDYSDCSGGGYFNGPLSGTGKVSDISLRVDFPEDGDNGDVQDVEEDIESVSIGVNHVICTNLIPEVEEQNLSCGQETEVMYDNTVNRNICELELTLVSIIEEQEENNSQE